MVLIWLWRRLRASEWIHFLSSLLESDPVSLQVIDKSFGFDTAVEEAQRAINAAHVEAESVKNGVGLVKLMGRYSGK